MNILIVVKEDKMNTTTAIPERTVASISPWQKR